MRNLFYLAAIFLFIQCDNSLEIDMTPVNALAPIYTNIEIGDLVSEGPRSTVTLEQIDYYKNYILIIEKESGVHVIDNSDLDAPKTTGFLKLPGITNFILNENYLIASLANHIVTIEIIDIDNSTITSIISQPSPNGTGSYPTDTNFGENFECVDLTKGIVSGWEMKLVVNPQCSVVR